MKKGKLFIISGQSGVGKNTIIKQVLARHKNLYKVITFTTRDPRPEEIPGIDHFFVYPQKFKEMIANHEFIEYAQVHCHLYGTPKKQVENILNQGKNAIMEIDVQGTMQVKNMMPDAVLIFIKYDSNNLENIIRQRILNDCARGETPDEEIKRRITSAHKEAQYEKNYNYVVVNPEGHVEEAVSKVEDIILKLS